MLLWSGTIDIAQVKVAIYSLELYADCYILSGISDIVMLVLLVLINVG